VGGKVAKLAKLRRRRSISQPSEEAEGNRSVRWVGEKVAELARLRRRRLISQPRVAELARLPWVFKRVALNPAKGCTPCAVSPDRRFRCWSDVPIGRVPWAPGWTRLRNPARVSPNPRGINPTPPQRFNPFGIGRRLSRGFSRNSSDWSICPRAESPARPCAHGMQPFAGLSAARSVTQGSLASSATLGWIIKRLRRSLACSATFSPTHRTLLFPSAPRWAVV